MLLLPGSREGELKRHLPVMLDAVNRIIEVEEVSFRMVLPSRELVEMALPVCAKELNLKMGRSEEAGELRATGLMKHVTAQFQIQVGSLDTALRSATIAIASTGTVTMECALFNVPTVALYKTSWGTYQIGKRIITVKYLAMPNLLADEAVFPEFVQDEATGRNLAEAALALLRDEGRRKEIQDKLGQVIAGLGSAGANVRTAKAIWRLLNPAAK